MVGHTDEGGAAAPDGHAPTRPGAAHATRLKALAGLTVGVGVAVGAWFAGQVVVFDHAAPLSLQSSVANLSAPLRPDAPLRVSLRGFGAELRGARLVRADRAGGPEQVVPVEVAPDAAAEGSWRILGPDGQPALATDGDYRLTVEVAQPRPALPFPRPDLEVRQFQFSTVLAPRPSLPADTLHPRWGEAVSVAWSLPMQNVSASVEPAAPLRAWVDPADPKRTWLRLGGDGGDGLADGQTYTIRLTDARSTDGLALRQPASLRVAVPERPRILNVPAEPVTLQPGESFVLEASRDLARADVEVSADAPARARADGRRIQVDLRGYRQGAEFDVRVRGGAAADGAPLASPVTVHLRTPAALGAPTFEPEAGTTVPLSARPAVVFPEPVADQAAAAAALRLDPPVAGEWQWTAPERAEFVPERPLPPTTTFRLSVAGGPDGPRGEGGGFLEQAASSTFRTGHDKRIDVSLSQQRLLMIQDGRVVNTIATATGVAAAPTPTGTFYVQYKSPQMRFRGVNPDGSHYDIPDVHWVMPFWGDYTIHGAYWRGRFGTPGSDGCVSMTDADAQVLYNWAEVGTPIVIHP